MDISYTSEFDAKRYEAYIRRALGLKATARASASPTPPSATRIANGALRLSEVFMV